MPYPHVSESEVPTRVQSKPRLNSLDSGEECTLAHLAEVCRLVELADHEDKELKGYLFDDSCLFVA